MARVPPLASLLAIGVLLAACAEPAPSSSASSQATATARPVPTATLGPSAAPSVATGGVYLAIGDSLTFGIGVRRPAREGFVARVADALRHGEPRIAETRIFAVPGETAAGFLARRLDDVISAIDAHGSRVELVTIGLGANELLRARRDPSCAADRQSGACRAVLTRAMDEAAAPLEAIVAAVRGALAAQGSDARVLVLAYYSPETDPLAVETIAGADGVVSCDAGDPRPGLNDRIACVASRHGAVLVDLYVAFAGRERELTRIGARDVHPNAAGYAVIADAIRDVARDSAE